MKNFYVKMPNGQYDYDIIRVQADTKEEAEYIVTRTDNTEYKKYYGVKPIAVKTFEELQKWG